MLTVTERLPLEAVVHYEKYTDYSEDEVDKHYQDKELITTNQEFVKENNVQSLAHVFTDVRYKRDDNILFSKALIDVLTQQGFMNNR